MSIFSTILLLFVIIIWNALYFGYVDTKYPENEGSDQIISIGLSFVFFFVTGINGLWIGFLTLGAIVGGAFVFKGLGKLILFLYDYSARKTEENKSST